MMSMKILLLPRKRKGAEKEDKRRKIEGRKTREEEKWARREGEGRKKDGNQKVIHF